MTFTPEELATIGDALALAIEERAALAKAFPSEAAEQLAAIAEMETLRARVAAYMPPLPRFFVAYTDDNGDSLDWFIDAPSRSRALVTWRALAMVRANYSGGKAPRVFQLPPTGTQARALPWHDPAGVMPA